MKTYRLIVGYGWWQRDVDLSSQPRHDEIVEVEGIQLRVKSAVHRHEDGKTELHVLNPFENVKKHKYVNTIFKEAGFEFIDIMELNVGLRFNLVATKFLKIPVDINVSNQALLHAKGDQVAAMKALKEEWLWVPSYS